MRHLLWLLLVPDASSAQLLHEAEIQRALVQRDQMSFEFSAGAAGSPPPALEALHARQLSETMQPLAPELRSYQRSRMAEERELVFSPPVVRAGPPAAPLPLPGRPRRGVDPVTPDRFPD